MKKILTIIGARPQIIKAAAISRTIASQFSALLEEHLLHTGQHYDAAMSQTFFNELNIPQPHINLNVGSGTHGWQTARMLEGIEQALLHESYDGVLIYGDTNSTLAGALAASKLHIPVFHVEAGLRSFNLAMPEEQNRIVADQLSSRLYAPTQTAVDNLSRQEELSARTLLTGDIMLDNALHYTPQALRCGVLERHHLQPDAYFLATIHRDFNTDNPVRLSNIISGLALAAQTTDILLPLHPRTAARLQSFHISLPDRVHVIPPASYLEMLALEHHARLVITDSGGVQKEAYFMHRPSVILRPETEWKEIVDHGAATLADADSQRIADACTTMCRSHLDYPPLFGDGSAAENIITDILKYIS